MDHIKWLLIVLAYALIGFGIYTNHNQQKTIQITQDSIRRLIIIEMITKEQFDILQDKVDKLENYGSRTVYK